MYRDPYGTPYRTSFTSYNDYMEWASSYQFDDDEEPGYVNEDWYRDDE